MCHLADKNQNHDIINQIYLKEMITLRKLNYYFSGSTKIMEAIVFIPLDCLKFEHRGTKNDRPGNLKQIFSRGGASSMHLIVKISVLS